MEEEDEAKEEEEGEEVEEEEAEAEDAVDREDEDKEEYTEDGEQEEIASCRGVKIQSTADEIQGISIMCKHRWHLHAYLSMSPK